MTIPNRGTPIWRWRAPMRDDGAEYAGAVEVYQRCIAPAAHGASSLMKRSRPFTSSMGYLNKAISYYPEIAEARAAAREPIWASRIAMSARAIWTAGQGHSAAGQSGCAAS